MTIENTTAQTAKPITAMTPAEQVAISQDRATVENAQWEQINAYAATVMNAHAPSANLVALRKYLAN